MDESSANLESVALIRGDFYLFNYFWVAVSFCCLLKASLLILPVSALLVRGVAHARTVNTYTHLHT